MLFCMLGSTSLQLWFFRFDIQKLWKETDSTQNVVAFTAVFSLFKNDVYSSDSCNVE
jgi:hypothetical protein